MFMFKLLAGTHIQRTPNGSRETIKAGKKFMADTRLDLRFGRDKYQLLNEPVPVSAQQATLIVNPQQNPVVGTPDLDTMDEEHLRKFAQEEEIDLKGIKKGNREEMLKRIKDHLK